MIGMKNDREAFACSGKYLSQQGQAYNAKGQTNFVGPLPLQIAVFTVIDLLHSLMLSAPFYQKQQCR